MKLKRVKTRQTENDKYPVRLTVRMSKKMHLQLILAEQRMCELGLKKKGKIKVNHVIREFIAQGLSAK